MLVKCKYRAGQRVPMALLLLVVLNVVTGSTSQEQLQEGWLSQTTDAPALPPTVHLSYPGIHAPPGPRTALTQNGTRRQHPSAAEPGSPGAPRPKVPLFAVVWMSAVMSSMSCVGALPYFFVRQLPKPWAGLANAVASGVMLTASYGLLAEGGAYSGTYMVAGMLLGVLFVRLSQQYLEQYEVDSFEQLAGADARRVLLFLAVMAVHAIGEGGGVGVSFAGDSGWAQGVLVSLAIGLHNIPEGLAVATVMAAKGVPPGRALLWTALTALPQALVAPPAYAFVGMFRVLLPLALGFAAGCMIWIVFAELLPDALGSCEAEQVATFATGAAAWLQGLAMFLSDLETPSGTLASPFGDYQAVLPLGIGNLMLQLLPACLIPGLAACLAAKAPCSTATAAAAAAGMLSSYTVVSGMQLVISSRHPVLCGLVLPLVGAVGTSMLWKRLMTYNSRHRLSLKDHGADCKWHIGNHCLECRSTRHDESGNEPQGCETQVAIGPTSLSAGVPHHRSSYTGGGPTTPSIIHCQPECIQNGRVGLDGVDQRDGSSTTSSGSNTNSWPSAAHGQQCKAPGTCGLWCSQELSATQPRSRHVQLQFGHLPQHCKNGAYEDAYGSSCWWRGLEGSSGSGLCGSRPILVAGLLAVCAAVGAGTLLGMQLAGAVAARQDSMSHVAVALTIVDVIFAAIYVGLLKLLMVETGPYLRAAAAMALSSTPVAVAMAILLMKPSWAQRGVVFGAKDVLQGLLIGFNIVVLSLVIVMLSHQWGRRCLTGLTFGVASGLLSWGTLSLLCSATP